MGDSGIMKKSVTANSFIVVLVWVILTGKGNIAAISNPDESVQETCDGDKFCVDIKLKENTSLIEVSLSHHQSNNFLQCSVNIRPKEELKCAQDDSVFVKYKQETKSLQFCMKFNQTKHSEKKLVVRRNGEDYKSILLLPCRAGFNATAVHSKTHVTIICEHEAFKLSKGGIKIKRENNTVAQCVLKKECIGAKALANGIQYITKYDPKIKYRCEMDGQSVQINYTEQVIPNPDQGSLHSSSTGGLNRIACCLCEFLFLSLGYYLG